MDLTMKLEVKYIFPTSSRSTDYCFYQLPNGPVMRKMLVFFQNVSKSQFTYVLDQKHLRNIKNNLQIFQENELLNVTLNIAKNFFLNLNHYLILLYDVLKLRHSRKIYFTQHREEMLQQHHHNSGTMGAVISQS